MAARTHRDGPGRLANPAQVAFAPSSLRRTGSLRSPIRRMNRSSNLVDVRAEAGARKERQSRTLWKADIPSPPGRLTIRLRSPSSGYAIFAGGWKIR